MLVFITRSIGFIFALLPAILSAHGGGLDANGGHFKRKTGIYHCHREPCFTKKNANFGDQKEEIDVARPFQSKSNFCGEFAQFGNPSPQDKLLCKTAFAIGHSCSLRSAKWVAYFVNEQSPSDLNVDRSDDFRADQAIDPDCRKELSDFGAGFDRGHLVSSETLDWSRNVNSETFLLSNMSPQLPGFNRAIWRGLENRERKWASQRGRLLVIAGPIFSGSSVSSFNRLHIPSHFYKIIYDQQAREARAFLLPHRALKTTSLNLFEVTIDEIEMATGLDFFSGLDPKTETRIERSIPSESW